MRPFRRDVVAAFISRLILLNAAILTISSITITYTSKPRWQSPHCDGTARASTHERQCHKFGNVECKILASTLRAFIAEVKLAHVIVNREMVTYCSLSNDVVSRRYATPIISRAALLHHNKDNAAMPSSYR